MATFRTFKQQAELLIKRGMRSAHGLSDDDLCTEIEQHLQYINYYRLSAYWYPYRKMKEQAGYGHRHDVFENNTYWEVIWKYYLFDRRLRALLFDATSRIEIALRTQIAYQWASQSKSDTPQNINNQYKKNFQIQSYLLKINEFYINSQADCVIHHKQKYNIRHAKDLPIWVFVELTTFGNLITLLNYGLKKNLQRELARSFGFDSAHPFLSALSLLREVRNSCAHHERMWNRRWLDKKSYPRLSQGIDEYWQLRWDTTEKKWNKSSDGEVLCSDRASCAAILSMCSKILNNVASHSNWSDRALRLILESDIVNIAEDLGFSSNNWQCHPLWNKGN